MLKIERMVPDCYIKGSRDFQMFCKLLELVANSARYNAKNMQDVYDPNKCNNRMLDLLCTMYNYQPKNNPTDQDLRTILTNYTRLIKNKGSKIGVEQAVSMALKLQNIDRDFNVVIKRMQNNANVAIDDAYNDNNQKVINTDNSYIINIGINGAFEMKYLKEFLDIVKPAGYLYEAHDVQQSKSKSEIKATFELIDDAFDEDYSMTSEFTGAISPSEETKYGQMTQINRQEITPSEEE